MIPSVSEKVPADYVWLVRLRWGALAGQLLLISAAHFLFHLELHYAWLLGCVGVGLLTNIAAARMAASGRKIAEAWPAGLMGFDILLLTAMLSVSGGAFNPFSSLYLVNIALAAVVLRPVWAWALFTLALACFGLLFTSYLSFSEGGHHLHTHLQGMWVAFGITAAFIVYFVHRIRNDLAATKEKSVRNERLASLATLAAGAAHELSTPLSTIALAAKELERGLQENIGAERTIGDARLIRSEVERCRDVLKQMSERSGEARGEPFASVSLRDFFNGVAGVYAGRVRFSAGSAPPDETVEIPVHALTQAVRGIVKNAVEASPVFSPVEVEAELDGVMFELTVRDWGAGMTAETLSRAGEPFYTTKEPGRGMGLGLFLARSVAEQLGGELKIDSTPGKGTSVSIRLPLRRSFGRA